MTSGRYSSTRVDGSVRPLISHPPAATLAAAKGRLFGLKSPVGMLSEWLYAECRSRACPGASASLDPDQEERAIYVADGEVDIAGETFEGPRLLIFRPGDRITVRAPRRARLMLLGGAALEGPR